MVNSDNEKLYEYSITYAEWKSYIELYIFDEIDRKILTRHMLDNVPFEKVAEELQLTPLTVKRRYKKSKDRLITRLSYERKIAPR